MNVCYVCVCPSPYAKPKTWNQLYVPSAFRVLAYSPTSGKLSYHERGNGEAEVLRI